MSEQVYSAEGSLGNRRRGAEGWAALNKELPHLELAEGASLILTENILRATDDKASEEFLTALEALERLGLPSEQANELSNAISDGAVVYVSRMAEAAFIAGCELGYRGLVVAPVKGN
jgi:hypothetical protein